MLPLLTILKLTNINAVKRLEISKVKSSLVEAQVGLQEYKLPFLKTN